MRVCAYIFLTGTFFRDVISMAQNHVKNHVKNHVPDRLKTRIKIFAETLQFSGSVLFFIDCFARGFFDYFAGHNHVKPSKVNFNTLLKFTNRDLAGRCHRFSGL